MIGTKRPRGLCSNISPYLFSSPLQVDYFLGKPNIRFSTLAISAITDSILWCKSFEEAKRRRNLMKDS